MLIAAAYRNRSCLHQLPRSVLSNWGMIGFLILCLAVFWRPRSRDARWGVFFSASSPSLFINPRRMHRRVTVVILSVCYHASCYYLICESNFQCCKVPYRVLYGIFFWRGGEVPTPPRKIFNFITSETASGGFWDYFHKQKDWLLDKSYKYYYDSW